MRIPVFLLLALTAGFPACARADGWGYLYGAVKLTSDYRFHGFSESDRHGTIQGNLHWIAPDDWYAGIFASGVDFRDGSTSYEMDFYGGRHLRFGADDLNLEVLEYTFPDHAGPAPGYDAVQASGEYTHAIGKLTLATKLEGRYGHPGAGYEIDGSASYAINDWLSASGTTGYQNGVKSFGRSNWDAGLTASSKNWLLDLRYSGTDRSRAHCYFTNWCASGFSATVTYQFGWTL